MPDFDNPDNPNSPDMTDNPKADKKPIQDPGGAFGDNPEAQKKQPQIDIAETGSAEVVDTEPDAEIDAEPPGSTKTK